jgi:hypothetical protein
LTLGRLGRSARRGRGAVWGSAHGLEVGRRVRGTERLGKRGGARGWTYATELGRRAIANERS